MVIFNKREYTDYEKERMLSKPYESSIKLEKELEIPQSTIRKFRRENGIFTRDKLSLSNINEFVEKYHELQCQERMAEYYNVNHHTIAKFCKKIGFDDSCYKRKKLTKEQIDEIISLYYQMSAAKVAEKLGVSEEAVSGVWYRNGLRGKERRVYRLGNEDYFDKIDDSNKAYFLGFIAADGCIYSPKIKEKQKILRICINKKDVKILEVLKKELDTDKPISYDLTKEYSSLEISSNRLCEGIERLGLSSRKTYGNTIANVTNEFMPDFIRGYFDGDGSILNGKYAISIAGYEGNLEKIQRYLKSKFIFSNFIYDKRKYGKSECGDFGSLRILNRTSLYSFLKLIYKNKNDCYLDRKYKVAKTFIDNIETSEKTKDKQIMIYYKYAVLRES